MKKFVLFLSVYFLAASCFSLQVYKNGVTASFYGADFHGKKTSSGEMFNMYDYTCANKELPFDTVLKVTNLANGKSVNVRVNDRGPFVVGREIDLSTAAARSLDMMKTGTTKVKLEIIQMGPNTKLSVATAESARKIMIQRFGASSVNQSQNQQAVSKSTKSTANASTGSATKSTANASTGSAAKSTEKSVVPKEIIPDKIWDIQVASFASRENAEKFANELYKKGFKKLVYQSTKGVTRVVVTKVPSADVEKTANRLRSAGYNDFVVKERKNG